MNSPLLLLLGVGFLLGLNFPLGKLAMAEGIDPALWAALISLGAGLAMLLIIGIIHLRQDRRPRPQPPHGEMRAKRASNHEGSMMRRRGVRLPILRGSPQGRLAPQDEGGGAAPLLRYAIISGFLSYVVPNFLTFSAIPKIGSGLAAIMFALSPVVTAALSLLLRVRPPSLLGVAGIALGLAGAFVIIFGRNADFSGGGSAWLFAALLIPVFLGVGNIYRTLAWPEGASPRLLAALTNLAAVPPLLAVALTLNSALDLAPLAQNPWLVLGQVAVSTAMFLMFFRLQLLGGPTYLSQIGYVAAAIGVFIGVVGFGETYPASVWLGVVFIAAGIALSTIAQVRQARAVGENA